METIDIGTVLKKFDDTVDVADNSVKEYGVRFITADGRVRTLIGRKNVKHPKQQLSGPLQERGKVMYNLKRNGVMLLHDKAANAPRSVKVACIFQFKDHDASQWYRVRH